MFKYSILYWFSISKPVLLSFANSIIFNRMNHKKFGHGGHVSETSNIFFRIMKWIIRYFSISAKDKGNFFKLFNRSKTSKRTITSFTCWIRSLTVCHYTVPLAVIWCPASLSTVWIVMNAIISIQQTSPDPLASWLQTFLFLWCVFDFF